LIRQGFSVASVILIVDTASLEIGCIFLLWSGLSGYIPDAALDVAEVAQVRCCTHAAVQVREEADVWLEVFVDVTADNSELGGTELTAKTSYKCLSASPPPAAPQPSPLGARASPPSPPSTGTWVTATNNNSTADIDTN